MSRGYTLIEVMSALAILGLGAAGVVAMQKSTQLANQNARMLATATTIASTWVERLRTDGVVWNNPAGTSDVNDTTWLNVALGADAGKYLRPTPVDNTASSAANLNGTDILPEDDNTTAAFCTQVAAFPLYDGVIGVSVRTLWSREGSVIKCADYVANAPDPAKIGGVYFTTAVLNNVMPGG